LRDRFVVGAGGAYNVGATGGASSFTIGVDNLPSHSHGISIGATTGAAGGHSHSASSSSTSVVNDPSHSHTYFNMSGADGRFIQGGGLGNNGGRADNVVPATTGITVTTSTSTSLSAVGDHAHSFTVTGTTGSTGSGAAIDNRPLYYALAYIMKA
jgi:hypothetical protein